MSKRTTAGRLLSLCFAAVVSAATLGCGGNTPSDYQLAAAERAAMSEASTLRFVLFSDTQYSVPFTDYDVEYQLGQQVLSLPPAVTSTWVSSFYRHAGANFALPYALEHLIAEEANKRATFGLFGGDLLEFSCQTEADRMFAALSKRKDLPFIVAIGNHDSAFHGAYDTDAVARSGQGDWDMYSFGLWGSVCSTLGGRSTKAGFISRLLNYYEQVWGLPLRGSVGLSGGAAYPRGVHLSGTARKRDWELTFAVKLGAEDAQSHRQSYFYQRWVHRDSNSGKPRAAITVLDTMDYGTRRVLCDGKAAAVQVGLAGAITSGQVEWLEGLRRPEGPHFVLSHYLPFESVERTPREGTSEKAAKLAACDTTYGTKCLGARLVAALPNATFVYGHVHQPFEEESLRSRDGKKCDAETRAEKQQSGEACECVADDLPLVRLPSLIDNKQYVVFEQGDFAKQKLPSSALESLQPFASSCNTCEERFAELVEIEHNIACLKGRRAYAGVACGDLNDAVQKRAAEGRQLCSGLSQDWKASHEPAWTKVEKVCANRLWQPTEQWRCILREQAKALAESIPEGELPSYGAALLANVTTTNRGNKKTCDAQR